MALLVIVLEAENEDRTVMCEVSNLVDGHLRFRSGKYFVAESYVGGMRFGSSRMGESYPVIFRITEGSHMNIPSPRRFNRLAKPRFRIPSCG